MKDRLILRGIQVYGYHGVMPEEKQLGQRFKVDVILFGDFSKAARSDALADALDYSRVHALVCETVGQGSFDLIESVAGRLCTVLLENLPITAVEVTVEKSNPPIPGFTGQALVTLLRDKEWLDT